MKLDLPGPEEIRAIVREEIRAAIKDMTGEICYRKDQAAFLLGMHVRTLERKMERREIGFVADGGLVLFRKSHIEDYASRHEIKVDYKQLSQYHNIQRAS